MSPSIEGKLKLYDRYLALPQVSRSGSLGINFEKILSQKAELPDDPSIKIDYFDSQIRAAATDSQRVRWYARKAKAAETTEKAAIEDEMLSKFFDNTDKDVEGLIAGVLLRKIDRTSDSVESGLLCDRLIQRYSDSTDSRVLYTVVRAFGLKAKAADNNKTKLEIYSTVIDRYKDISDFLVKDAVNDVIAAKFRLEMKGND